jgi:single-stranded DNA-binding protein
MLPMNINRVCFAGNLTGEPEVNYPPKNTEVVSASIVNNEFYGCADYGVGRISYAIVRVYR